MDNQYSISTLVQEISSSTEAFENSNAQDSNEARKQALEAARKLTAALATPEETVLHHSFEVFKPLKNSG